MSGIVVAALYHFARLDEYVEHQQPLLSVLTDAGVKGTILLAQEGVNGTIAGPREGIDAALEAIRNLPGCGELEHKESYCDEQPFLRLKVRLKKEIVTLGVPGVDPTRQVGTYVDPKDWNEVVDDPDTVVIDTRNDYEVAIGTFEGAVDPKTKSFRDFPEWFEKFRGDDMPSRVAMFCTGGIRCEKASSYLLSRGVNEVLHLKGGILKYLEEVPEADTRWQGECFVFDGRVAVKHGLEVGSYGQCFACRHPLSEEDMQDEAYMEGVSCPHCIEQYEEERRARFEERHRQVQLAKARGEQHLAQVLKK